MKKRILSMILTVVLLLSCVPVVAVSAETSERISFTSATFTAYKGWLDADAGGKDRYNQRANALELQEGTITNIVNGTEAKALSWDTPNYYPELYLNESGELVRDNRYDGVNQDVNLTTYLAEGYGKYYGVFKLGFSDIIKLDTFTIYNKNNDWHQNSAFDVLVSTDGTVWTVEKSFANMTNDGNWDGESDGILYKTIDMGGVDAKFVAVAINGVAVKGQCALWYAEATRAPEKTVYTVAELKEAIALGNSKRNFTIKLGSDLVCASDEWFGELNGTGLTIDGQGHTIYNVCNQFGRIAGDGITLKNIVFSGKDSENGSDITTKQTLFGWISGTNPERPVVLENVTTQRNMTSIDDKCGGFTQETWGTVVFKNCVNEGSLRTTTGGNWKVGGFVGIVNDGVTTIFESCVNKADVYASQAGGFVGIYQPGSTIRMTDCTNSGTITGFANGNGYGNAGGFIGSLNNSGDVAKNTFVTLTGCTNNGDVLVDSTASNDRKNAVGGLIGHAGNVNSSATYEIIIDNCAVYNCSIDAIDSDNAHGTFYAAAFIGKISPQSDTNLQVLAKNSYVSKVSISAGNARKFVGVGSHTVDVVFAENCMIYDVVETNQAGEVVEWNVNAMSGCQRTFSANADTKTGFVDTDAKNIISAGGTGFVQTDVATGKSDIRFVATLPEGFTLEDYEKVGFYVVALTDADTDGYTERVWIKSASCVYESIKADGVVKTAGQICDGAEYLFVAEITGISQLIGEVEFYVVPYIIANDGSIIYGQSSTYTVDTGAATQNP